MKKEFQQQEFSLLDLHFSRFLGRLSGLQQDKAAPFVAIVQQLSAALDSGDSCVDIAGREDVLYKLPEGLCISAAEYLEGRHAPLVLFNSKLFLYRYFHYEFRLAQQIRVLAGQKLLPAAEGLALLERLFAAESVAAGETDWQKEAARLALKSRLAIISGGPGTGKTTTVVKILALLLADSRCKGEELSRIVLVAPTGRAAMRLAASVAGSVAVLDIANEIKAVIPREAVTLHRLLGVRHNSSRFFHNSDNPLDCSVVVVDEASMVDLALMSKLVDALPPFCRLILLGDKDQLASVESGAVLAELLKGLPECGVQLQKSYRFDKNIKELAAAINSGDADSAWQLVAQPARKNLAFLSGNWRGFLAGRLTLYMEAVRQVVAADSVQHSAIAALFTRLRSFQILCATRKGRRGADQLNSDMVRLLAGSGFSCKGGDGWFIGRPVMITGNDYGLGLFNGDMGICLPGEDGEMAVWFERYDGGMAAVPYGRLPDSETAFAITIHKSQGAEFDEVAVVLPQRLWRGLGRELLYTAVTRAKKKVWLLAGRDVFTAMLDSSVSRQSGLQQLLALTGPDGLI